MIDENCIVKVRRKRQSKVSPLWSITNEVRLELESYSGANLSYLKEQDLAKLAILKVWSIRYYLPVSEVIRIIVPVLKQIIRSRKKLRGLGVPITTLTAVGTEKILEREIQELYPDGEHVRLWKEQEREKQLNTELLDETEGLPVKQVQLRPLYEYETCREFATGYEKMIDKKSKSMSNATQQHRRSKPYRLNPWL
jgi:hypothetical protein